MFVSSEVRLTSPNLSVNISVEAVRIPPTFRVDNLRRGSRIHLVMFDEMFTLVLGAQDECFASQVNWCHDWL